MKLCLHQRLSNLIFTCEGKRMTMGMLWKWEERPLSFASILWPLVLFVENFHQVFGHVVWFLH